MSFSDLPSELIYAISCRVPPDTIEAYGLTCHRLHNIAAPLIEEHRKLLAEYTKCSFTNASAPFSVYAICARPWIRHYPKSLELTANSYRRTLENPKTVNQKALAQTLMLQKQRVETADIRDLVRSTRLIAPHEEHIWIEQLDKGDEDYLFAFLIAIFPNLQRLRINLDRAKLEQVKEMLRRIRKQSQSGRPSRVLQGLRSVHILDKDSASTDSCDLEMFPLAAALPGVERLHGRNLVGMYRECYAEGWGTFPGASPSITHLSLETCGMSVEGLETLTRSLHSLQSFKYIAHRANWSLRAVADLLRPCCSTLHTLEISTGSGSARYIGTLRPFTALKNLTLDTDMLMRHAGRISRAVDILPASIERVTLCGNNLTEPGEREFLADLYRPAFTYPWLKSIGVEDSFGRRCIGGERLKFQREFRRQAVKGSGGAGGEGGREWMLKYR